MEQEHNPNKNAELAMEQNGNMIDGIITICLCRPGQKSRWTRCGNTRPSAAAGSVRSVDKKAAALYPSSCDGDAGGAGADR